MEKEKSIGQRSSPCYLDHLEQTGEYHPKKEVIKDTWGEIFGDPVIRTLVQSLVPQTRIP